MSKKNNHSDRGHAVFSPSSANIWKNCKNHIYLKVNVGEKQKSSKASEHGTILHELCEEYIKGEKFIYNPDTFKSFMETKTIPEEDDVRLAEKALIMLEGHMVENQYKLRDLEKRVFPLKLANHKLKGKKTLFGTVDVIAGKKGVLSIIDFKFGRIPVSSDRNSQLLCYAACMLDMIIEENIKKIEMVILQPLVKSNPDVYLIDVDLLKKVYKAVIKIIEATCEKVLESKNQKGLATLGEHCTFCEYKVDCVDFKEDYIRNNPSIEMLKSTDIKELEALFGKKDAIERFFKDLEQLLLNREDQLLTYKVQERLGISKWVSEGTAMSTLISTGLEDNEVYVKKPVSPAQAKKLIKEKRVDLKIEELIERKAIGNKLVKIKGS